MDEVLEGGLLGGYCHGCGGGGLGSRRWWVVLEGGDGGIAVVEEWYTMVVCFVGCREKEENRTIGHFFRFCRRELLSAKQSYNFSIMHPSTFHNQKSPHIHITKRLTKDQVTLLESCFESNKKLDPKRKQQLSQQLGIPPRQIAIWYQNKRARWKNQSMEHDYNMLQLQLEATLIENTHLEKEVEQLRAELNKVQTEQTRNSKYYNNGHQHQVDSNSLSRCGEEVGSSSRSLEDDVNNFYCYGQQVFEVEEMYAAACMMSSDLGVIDSTKNYF
ncbi:homeobox-leucine zipper protein ATHB-52-like [Rutidosis leptorrhynchoides]|uniref:homeobox-leucine zipper protein ATHB-52-like n=1 Tax=Rutidosis leptorrhynchoides TaxID=125765 RepID=UPI003A98D8CB